MQGAADDWAQDIISFPDLVAKWHSKFQNFSGETPGHPLPLPPPVPAAATLKAKCTFNQ